MGRNDLRSLHPWRGGQGRQTDTEYIILWPLPLACHALQPSLEAIVSTVYGNCSVKNTVSMEPFPFLCPKMGWSMHLDTVSCQSLRANNPLLALYPRLYTSGRKGIRKFLLCIPNPRTCDIVLYLLRVGFSHHMICDRSSQHTTHYLHENSSSFEPSLCYVSKCIKISTTFFYKILGLFR